MPRKRQRRRPWGSVTEVARGKKYVIRWPQNSTAGRKRLTKTIYGTYREACGELARLQTEHGSEKRVPTIGEAYEMWYLPWLKRQVETGKRKQDSLLAYTIRWRISISPRWRDVPVDHVKPLEVQRWLLSLTAATATHSIVILRKVLDFSVQYETVEVNRFRGRYEMPTILTHTKTHRVLSLSEAVAKMDEVRDTPAEAAFILACFGSARVGESLAVKTSEVKIAESHGISLATVDIVRRMGKGGYEPYPDGDLKTPQSARTLIIPEPFGTRLAEIRDRRAEEGGNWMSDRGDGLPLNIRKITTVWKPHGQGIPFSNLRSSWRTFAQFEWHIDPDLLELLMGHVLPGVTGKHYLRPSMGDLIDAFAGRFVEHLG